MLTDELLAAAAEFTPMGCRVLDLREFGRGNINATFLITLDDPAEPHFILQRLNSQVFPRPELVMHNLGTVTSHLRRRLKLTSLAAGRRFEVPRVRLTRDGRHCWLDAAGSFWRGLSFIDEAEGRDTIQDTRHAYEVGFALGLFHHLLSDLPAADLADTLPGFHLAPGYLHRYDEVLAARNVPVAPEVHYAMQFIEPRRAWVHVLEDAKAQGKLQLRPIHGDPKVNNVLMDVDRGQAVSLIDLDTVKPGLVHYDLGDLLRSGCNPLGEETGEWRAVRFDTDLCRAILQGYFSWAGNFLTPDDYAYLYDAIRLLAFELGLRFFTDYLAGNVYFRARHPEHNLARALVQFKLAESIESQEAAISAIILELE